MSDSHPPRVPLTTHVKRASIKAGSLLLLLVMACALGLLFPALAEWLGGRFSPLIPLAVYLACVGLATWAFVHITLDTARGRSISYWTEDLVERLLVSERVRTNLSLRDSALVGAVILFGLLCAGLIAAGFTLRWFAVLGWSEFAGGAGPEPASLSRALWGSFALEHLLDALLLGALSNFGVHFTPVEPRGFVSNLLILIFKVAIIGYVVACLKIAYRTRNEVIDSRKVDRGHYLELGREAMENGDFEQALAIYSNGVREHPRSALLIDWRAEALRKLGRDREADAEEQRAAKLRGLGLHDDDTIDADGSEDDGEGFYLTRAERMGIDEPGEAPPAELLPPAEDEDAAHLPFDDDPGISLENDSGIDLAGFGERDPE